MSKPLHERLLEHLQPLAHSPVRNYALPGLTSWLIGEPASDGSCVRLFHNTRHQQHHITPHSHKFDFNCTVLQGRVTNRIWTRRDLSFGNDLYATGELSGGLGSYELRRDCSRGTWAFGDSTYGPGESYAMSADQVHSIVFARDTWVLFIEDPHCTDTSVFLEPVVDGDVLPTMKAEAWMFRRS